MNLKAQNSKRGSAVVEAALIMPLLILIIIAMLRLAIFNEERVSSLCKEHEDIQQELHKDRFFDAEDALREKWIFYR